MPYSALVMSDPAHPNTMDDRSFLAAFAACSLEPFGHRQHLRVIWLLLGQHPLAIAIDRCCTGLAAYVAHLGVPERYHETLTWAYALLVHERRAALPEGHRFADFEAACPQLFADGLGEVRRYYSQAVLDSAEARARFVLPDRLELDA